MTTPEYDTDWYEIPNAFDALVSEAQVAWLREQLAQARKEISLLTEERNMALLRIDELLMKLP